MTSSRCILVRHGKAQASAASGLDSDRELEPLGWRQAEFLARELRGWIEQPTELIASRFSRARSTADVIARGLSLPVRLEAYLEVGHSCSAAVELIERSAPASTLLVVGHNPQLSEVGWALIRGVPAGDLGMRTGEALVIDLDRTQIVGGGELLARLRLETPGG